MKNDKSIIKEDINHLDLQQLILNMQLVQQIEFYFVRTSSQTTTHERMQLETFKERTFPLV